MPSVGYFNQTAPFWDFIASLEASGAEHPFFAAYGPQAREGPPPPPPGQGPPPPPGEGPEEPPHEGPPDDSPAGPPPPPHPHHPHHHHPHHGPPHPFGPGFPFRGRGGFRRGGGSDHCGRGEGGRRGWGGEGRRGANWDINNIAQFFASQLGVDLGAATQAEATTTGGAGGAGGKDFAPPVDVFDTEDAFVVHVSLPGAKKEDVGVNWDADRSELSVAGVIYRPGDEDFLKTLAMDERKVGVFDRKVRLGSRASPAQVDAESISARMEDGVLLVTIPKLDREYVDVKKVDIE